MTREGALTASEALRHTHILRRIKFSLSMTNPNVTKLLEQKLAAVKLIAR